MKRWLISTFVFVTVLVALAVIWASRDRRPPVQLGPAVPASAATRPWPSYPARPPGLQWGEPNGGLQMALWYDAARDTYCSVIRNSSDHDVAYLKCYVGYFEAVRVWARPIGDGRWRALPRNDPLMRICVGGLAPDDRCTLVAGQELGMHYTGGDVEYRNNGNITFDERLDVVWPAAWDGREVEFFLEQSLGDGWRATTQPTTVPVAGAVRSPILHLRLCDENLPKTSVGVSYHYLGPQLSAVSAPITGPWTAISAVANIPDVAARSKGGMISTAKETAGIIGPTPDRFWHVNVVAAQKPDFARPWARFRVNAASGEITAALDGTSDTYVPLDQWRAANVERLRAIAATQPTTR